MTAKDMTKLTGVASRTLDFWVRSKVLSPSVSKGIGSGSKRQYSLADVVQCKMAVMLRSMGIETSRIVPLLRRTRNKQVAFVIIDADGGVVTIPVTQGLSTFQFEPNRTAMLLINVTAIKASITGLAE
jgi:DNA-binding transcriptional MerR regulator